MVSWERPSQLEAQKPPVSYPGPHRHMIKVFSSHCSSSSLLGRRHLFPVTHFPSLWVEGGGVRKAGQGRGSSEYMWFQDKSGLSLNLG